MFKMCSTHLILKYVNGCRYMYWRGYKDKGNFLFFHARNSSFVSNSQVKMLAYEEEIASYLNKLMSYVAFFPWMGSKILVVRFLSSMGEYTFFIRKYASMMLCQLWHPYMICFLILSCSCYKKNVRKKLFFRDYF